jgi:hypothetical protein
MAYVFGTHVDRGDAIALSGAVQVPGGPLPTGPHLHFEVQTGALDVYATSLDPVPILLNGLYGSGSGTLDDVTPEQDAKLSEALSGVRDLNGALFYSPADPTYGNFAKLFEDKVRAIVAAELAKVPAGIVDQAAVLAAIAKVQAKLDKDLA